MNHFLSDASIPTPDLVVAAAIGAIGVAVLIVLVTLLGFAIFGSKS